MQSVQVEKPRRSLNRAWDTYTLLANKLRNGPIGAAGGGKRELGGHAHDKTGEPIDATEVNLNDLRWGIPHLGSSLNENQLSQQLG